MSHTKARPTLPHQAVHMEAVPILIHTAAQSGAGVHAGAAQVPHSKPHSHDARRRVEHPSCLPTRWRAPGH
eukprot:353225-Chlamydomonas_euryale.AAC.1